MTKITVKLLIAYLQMNTAKMFILLASVTLGISSVLFFTDASFETMVSTQERTITVSLDSAKEVKNMLDTIAKGKMYATPSLSCRLPETVYPTDDMENDGHILGCLYKDKWDNLHSDASALIGRKLKQPGEVIYSDFMWLTLFDIGDEMTLGENNYKLVGRVGLPYDVSMMVCYEDFFKIYEQTGATDLTIKLYYHGNTKTSKLEKVKEKLEKYTSVYCVEISDEPYRMTVKEYLHTVKDYLYITVIAVMNSMFIYYSFVHDRLKDYSILKLAGLNRRQIVIQFFAEIMIIYHISFVISLVLLVLYKFWHESGYYNTLPVALCSYVVALVCIVTLHMTILYKVIRKSPMVLYRESRVLK